MIVTIAESTLAPPFTVKFPWDKFRGTVIAIDLFEIQAPLTHVKSTRGVVEAHCAAGDAIGEETNGDGTGEGNCDGMVGVGTGNGGGTGKGGNDDEEKGEG